MKRILTVLVVALVLAAMLVVIAAPAFADSPRGAKKVGNPDDRPQKQLNFQGGPQKFQGPKKQHF